jgi:hypothetical protein
LTQVGEDPLSLALLLLDLSADKKAVYTGLCRVAEAWKRVVTEVAERVSCFASAVRKQVTEKGPRLDRFASGLEVAQEVGSHFDAWPCLLCEVPRRLILNDYRTSLWPGQPCLDPRLSEQRLRHAPTYICLCERKASTHRCVPDYPMPNCLVCRIQVQ